PAFEVVVAEVGLVGSGGDDETVVLELEVHVTGGGVDGPGGHIDPVDVTEGDGGVLLVPEDQPRGRRDLADGQDAGGHLVQQRLEEVVTGPGDQGYVHVRLLERARCGQPAESGPDDDHAVAPTPRC